MAMFCFGTGAILSQRLDVDVIVCISIKDDLLNCLEVFFPFRRCLSITAAAVWLFSMLMVVSGRMFLKFDR